MRVLVTGGAGFIGSNLVRELAQRPHVSSIVVIDDFSTGFRENLDGTDVEVIEGSILDHEALRKAARHADSVVHLAALGSVPRSIENPVRSHEVNATGTLMVLQAAREFGNAHVVLASSSSVYGANRQLPKVETMRCQPMSPYAVSKLATEAYAEAFAEVYGLPVLPFRFFNVFGPRQRAGHVYAAVIPVFLDAAISGQRLPINGDGTYSRDFTFVGTVATILADAVVNHISAGATNLAFGTRTTLLGLVKALSGVMETKLEVDFRPARPGDVPHSQAADTQLRALFPDVVPTPLEEGLRSTHAWMLEHLRSSGRLE